MGYADTPYYMFWRVISAANGNNDLSTFKTVKTVHKAQSSVNGGAQKRIISQVFLLVEWVHGAQYVVWGLIFPAPIGRNACINLNNSPKITKKQGTKFSHLMHIKNDLSDICFCCLKSCIEHNM